MNKSVKTAVFEIDPSENFHFNDFIDFPDTLDLERCEDVDSLDISGFNVDVDPETSGQQVERETGVDHSDSSNESSDQSSALSNEEHEMDESTDNPNRTSLNNKPKRPLFESCIICQKSVKKMRDHLNYFHGLSSNAQLKVFLNTYYSIICTKRCFQCETCLKRFSFKQVHPKHHKITRIFDRRNEKLFPEPIQVALRGSERRI